MNELSKYLDELKKLRSLKNDSELATFLKVSRAHVSQIRAGSFMGELKCFELAEHLGREPLELLSLNRAIRNTDRKLHEYWLQVHRQIAVKSSV